VNAITSHHTRRSKTVISAVATKRPLRLKRLSDFDSDLLLKHNVLPSAANKRRGIQARTIPLAAV
jgi:hypothetical protein